MKRDIAVIPLQKGDDELIMAVDNSGSIGMKPGDDVHVPYEIVSYYNFRVAWMECVSAGAQPISIILHNFSGDNAWSSLLKGIKQGMKELDVTDLKIIGSTESNFVLNQSAVGLAIIGHRKKKFKQKEVSLTKQEALKVAVVGKPLVGQEVIDNQGEIAPLKLFQQLSKIENITILPVGSKGILYELNQLFGNTAVNFKSELDLEKSSGPATCFIIACDENLFQKVKEKCGNWLHEVYVISH